MNNHPENAETRIDQVLNALRDTEPPTGLEARITARIAQAAEARTLTTSPFAVKSNPAPTPFFAVILNVVKDPCILLAEANLYTAAATALTLLLTISAITILHHKPHAIAHPNKPYAPTQPSSLAQASNPGNTQVPQGFSLGSHTVNQRAGVLTPAPPQQPIDPDAIALAETLAPSRPAPPMPLTQQERLMLNVLRSGDQEEIAALNPVERDALFAQDQAAFQNFFAPPTPAPNSGDKE
jgi:hypothetical protein